jgi:sortase A
MALYKYVKSAPKQRQTRRKITGISFLFMSLGGGLLLWAMWPILSFTIFSDTLFSKIVTPVTEDGGIIKSSSLSPVAFAMTDPDTAVASDFSNANLWYPAAPQKHLVTPVNTYTLSIPKLKIENALVSVSGDDLSKSLVHYGGTSLPGQYGNTVIFGHSTLPQFYSPASYRSIFSLLPSLKAGDEITVLYDGIEYRYVIYDMVVLDPNDLSVLEQQFDDSYLTLVTCVPPGTYWKRLNVKARLQKLR